MNHKQLVFHIEMFVKATAVCQDHLVDCSLTDSRGLGKHLNVKDKLFVVHVNAVTDSDDATKFG